MKRNTRKLRLNRETLGHLSSGDAAKAKGGRIGGPCITYDATLCACFTQDPNICNLPTALC